MVGSNYLCPNFSKKNLSSIILSLKNPYFFIEKELDNKIGKLASYKPYQDIDWLVPTRCVQTFKINIYNLLKGSYWGIYINLYVLSLILLACPIFLNNYPYYMRGLECLVRTVVVRPAKDLFTNSKWEL